MIPVQPTVSRTTTLKQPSVFTIASFKAALYGEVGLAAMARPNTPHRKRD
jgi:hypothetical protein